MGDTRMDLEHVRRTGYELAEAMAPGWQHRRAFIEAAMGPVAEWMIRELAPQPGDTWLELAARAGETGFEAARRVGDAGRLISTDFSLAIVDVARRRGAALGIDNVDDQVLDAERIELNAGSSTAFSADWDTSDGRPRGGNGRDPPRASSRRTPGAGRVGCARAQPILRDSRQHRRRATSHVGARAGEPRIIQSGERTPYAELLEGPGFSIVRIQEVPVCFRPRDFLDDYMSVSADVAGPIALVVRGLSDSDREGYKAQLGEDVRHFAEAGRYEVRGVALVAVAI